MSRLRIVFMGSPEIAVETLCRVAEVHDVVLAVTQPDRPAGRGQSLTPPPVKVAAAKLGIPTIQPVKIRTPEFAQELAAYRPDIAVVLAYGRILPPHILALPPLGCVNIHTSLLPRHRGAAPIQWAIMKGDSVTGVSVMQMEAGLDTGPVFLAKRIAIESSDTTGTLTSKLATLSAAACIETLEKIGAGTITPEPQNDSEATAAPLLTKSDGQVDFSRSAAEVSAWVRGTDPWPGAATEIPAANEKSASEMVKLFAPKIVPGSGDPGTVLDCDSDGLVVACGSGAVAFGELQLAGRKRMTARALTAGRPIPPGTQLIFVRRQ